MASTDADFEAEYEKQKQKMAEFENVLSKKNEVTSALEALEGAKKEVAKLNKEFDGVAAKFSHLPNLSESWETHETNLILWQMEQDKEAIQFIRDEILGGNPRQNLELYDPAWNGPASSASFEDGNIEFAILKDSIKMVKELLSLLKERSKIVEHEVSQNRASKKAMDKLNDALLKEAELQADVNAKKEALKSAEEQWRENYEAANKSLDNALQTPSPPKSSRRRSEEKEEEVASTIIVVESPKMVQ
ncbi:hypothetical protein B0J14DRAFT_557145 [Halenospora varia]|nr:hypothetical protein B0J14DRAFT_557145 [Halenospora varia]